MKKNKILLLIIGLFMLFTGTVHAESEDKTCNAVSLNELRTLAANIKVSYVEGTEKKKDIDPEFGGEHEYDEDVLLIKIYNMNSKLYLDYDMTSKSVSIEPSEDPRILTLNDADKDGVITIKQQPLGDMITYKFDVYSMSYGCGSKKLRTIKLTLPRFNYYSTFTICQDIPDYYLCKKYVTFDSDNNPDFYDKVTEYKAKLKEQEKNGEDDNNGGISETISKVSKNKYVIVGVIVAIGVVITVLIIRRKRSGK